VILAVIARSALLPCSLVNWDATRILLDRAMPWKAIQVVNPNRPISSIASFESCLKANLKAATVASIPCLTMIAAQWMKHAKKSRHSWMIATAGRATVLLKNCWSVPHDRMVSLAISQLVVRLRTVNLGVSLVIPEFTM